MNLDQVKERLTRSGGSPAEVEAVTVAFGLAAGTGSQQPSPETLGARAALELIRLVCTADALGLSEKADQTLDAVRFTIPMPATEDPDKKHCRIPPPHICDSLPLLIRFLLAFLQVLLTVVPAAGSALERLAKHVSDLLDAHPL